MKIVIIRSGNKYSGAERYSELLVKSLSQLGASVDIITSESTLAKNLHAKHYSWLPVEVGTKKQLLTTLIRLPYIIFRYLIVVIGYDIVCFESRTEMLFLSAFLRLFGYKVVWIQHGPLFASRASSLIKWFYRYASRFATKIIAVSEHTKYDLVVGGVDYDRIIVIYIGVPVHPMRVLKKHKFTIGFLGTVTKEKGIDRFVELTKGYKTIVIGDGPDRALVHGPITGFVTNPETFLKNVDVLFLPTRHMEGISMAILEAMSYGIPVVATDIGGNNEIIKNGYNGLLLKSDEEPTWTHDWTRLGKNAQQTVSHAFNIEKQAWLFLSFFQSL